MKKIVAIGALGGSGTRVVAQIISNLGVDIGDNLNYENDNLIFTALFRMPKWYQNTSQNDIRKRFVLFDKWMNRKRLTTAEKYLLLKSSLTNNATQRNYIYYYNLFFRKPNRNRMLDYWGWKEPNTQLYLDEINDFFPQVKYIHVLRNGLDMAFSKNRNQLKNWGFKYDIFFDKFDNQQQICIKQLDYWIRSTKEVLSKRHKFGDRFFLLNFTNFCIRPEKEINKLIEFLNINIDTIQTRKLIELVKLPKSFDRYKQEDISFFRDDQLQFVKEMGFIK